MKQNTVAVPIILELNTKLIRTIVIDIGPWNMDAVASKNVTHSLNIEKIVSFQAVILNDDKDWLVPISYAEGWTEVDGFIDVEPAFFAMTRRIGGDFDQVGFDNAVMNRGFITVQYFD